MWYLIFALVITTYLLINIVLPGNVDGTTLSYIIQPVLWILVAITAFIFAKHEGFEIFNFKKIRRWQVGQSPFQAGLLIGGFHVSLLVIAGLFVGFGNSPNLITPTSFFIFLIYIFSQVNLKHIYPLAIEFFFT